MLVPNSDLAMTLEAHEHVAFVTPGDRTKWGVRKAAPHLKKFMARNGNGTGAGPAQQEALGKRDVLESILRNLGGSNYREAGRAAARWGALNSEHREACKTHQPWTDLTQAVFPGSRAPNPRHHEPTNPKDWFYFLCNRNARLDVIDDLVSKIFITQVFLRAQSLYYRHMSDVDVLKKRRARQRRTVGDPIPLGMGECRLLGSNPQLPLKPWMMPVKQWMIDEELDRARTRKKCMKEAAQNGAVTWATRDHPEQWVGELAQLNAYMCGLYAKTD